MGRPLIDKLSIWTLGAMKLFVGTASIFPVASDVS